MNTRLHQEFLAKREEVLNRIERRFALIQKLQTQKVKFDEEAIIAITEKDNKVIFLERGNARAGYKHILNHADDFKRKGINVGKLPELIMSAVSDGKQNGFQGKKRDGRVIYQLTFFQKPVDVAISIGTNGFVVGANPTTLKAA